MKIKAPKGIALKYRSELRKISREIREDIKKELLPLLEKFEPAYTRDSWGDQFESVFKKLKEKYADQKRYESIGKSFVKAVDNQNARAFRNVGIDLFGKNDAIKDFLGASTINNVSLIKSIASEYLEKVEAIVFNNTTAGVRSTAIKKQIEEQYDVSAKRAKVIARDQTAKIAGNLNEKRQRSAGFEYFRWLDSDDKDVRTHHEYLAEQVTEYGKGVYRWDDLPKSDKGVPIAPGQDFSCRCTAIPMTQRQVDRFQAKRS